MTDADERHGLLATVNEVIEKFGLIRSGDAIVVGVSGGPDSVALLHVLSLFRDERYLRLTAAHLDHGLRPESRQDAEFTRDLSESLGIRAFVDFADVRRRASELGISVEEAGRKARYDFFERVRAAVGAQTVATAHHLDDQMETFFLRVFRGSTLTGLGGIAPKRGRIIRPLIESRRTEILHFLDERHIPYRIDGSNLSADTDRNFIRNRLIPLIAERFPDFARPLMRSVKSIREEEQFLESMARELKSYTVRQGDDRVVMAIPDLLKVPRVLAGRVVLGGLYGLSGPSVRWARVHLDTIFKVMHSDNPSAEIDLPGGIVLVREYDRLTFAVGRPERPHPFSVTAAGPGDLRVPSTNMIMTFEIIEARRSGVSVGAAGPLDAYFDADDAPFPLTVRSLQPGDRLRPWGMTGTRKLKEILIDRKVPRRLRMKIPLLEKDNEILWIAGIRRGRAAPVVPETRRVLKVMVKGLRL
ncbi:MAG: tRNA lysidine(34) synthetase TilS [Pseudomonadota bacterium]